MILFPSAGCDWLVVGLGNPGGEYQNTRHNAGFMAVDRIADALGVRITKIKYKALCATANYRGQKLLLLKPETFMNASGLAVEAAAHFYKIPPERVLVLFDDISLPVGQDPRPQVRLRRRAQRHQVHHRDASTVRISRASRSASAPSRTPIMTWPTGCSPAFPRPSSRSWIARWAMRATLRSVSSPMDAKRRLHHSMVSN